MNSNSSTIRLLNYLFIYLVINYSLISRYVIGSDTTGYGLIALSFLIVILNYSAFSSIQSQKPIKIWLIWCIYAFINYYLHPHYSSLTLWDLYSSVFIPLIVMTVVAIEFQKDKNRVLWVCLITHLLYMLFGYYFDSGIIYRINDQTNILGNSYATISCFSIFYLALLNKAKKLRITWFSLLSVVCVIVLAMSGTRKAFGAGLIFLSFWALSFLDLKKIWTWVIVASFFIVGYWGFDQLMERTFIGARIELLEEQGETYLPDGAPEILKIFGDRASHYYYGWQSFLEHPIFGVGTKQAHVLQGYSDQAYTHTEYMAQLVDGGIIGFCIFILFYYWIVKNVYQRHKHDKMWGRCVLGALVAILFIYVTSWAWEFPHYFICLGILIGYCNMDRMEVYQLVKK